MKAAVATLQDELCNASEEAQRLAEWQATGRISSLSVQVPFNCSASGSSADPLEPPAGTQLGTILEQAAAIISYSQVAHDHTSPAKPQQPAPGWLPHAVLHAAHTQKRDTLEAPPHASQTASAAGGALPPPSDSADAAGGDRLQRPLTQADGAADTAAKAVGLLAQGGQEMDQGNAVNASLAAALQPGDAVPKSGPVQGNTQPHSDPVPDSVVGANGTDAEAAVGTAQEPQTQAGAAASGAVLLEGSAQQALLPEVRGQRSAAAASEQAPAGLPAEEKADHAMSQETEEDFGDIAPTEVQLPDQAPLLHAVSSPRQHSPSPVVAPASRHDHLTESAQPEVHQTDAGASPQVPVGAEVGTAQAAAVHKAPLAAQQMRPGSPTPHLQLQLTYLEPELADHHAGPAAEAASQQLQLQLTTEPPMREAHAASVDLDDACRDGVQSPAELDLNLDTQLPDPSADKAPSVCAPAGGCKSPAPNRGWWNQPWSVAQHVQPAEEPDSLPAGLQAHAQPRLCVYVTGCMCAVAYARLSCTKTSCGTHANCLL